jgi:hypothetical protein
MVIEITKRYIIGDCTLETIIKDCSEKYDDMGEENFEFKDFLYNEMQSFYHDEEIINGDIKQLEEICELQIKLDKLKEKYLS